ncbi:polymer-forming cytoskeletal protein [Prosthecobacter debontii]|uniref:polymer-forming cytoskeletal protein n=1 Tax=Prosthecobacter debontii TaxID=48467 RepID=UPI0009993CCF|nr:polymer-forming cytoskeletal protein [Prosthecobacter debontii]
MSTFCKKCGVHLTIHRKKVTASTVTRSGMGMPDPWADSKPKPPADIPSSQQEEDTAPTGSTPEPSAQPAAADPLVAEMQLPVSEEEAAEGGFGVFLKQQATQGTGPSASEKAPIPETPQEDEKPVDLTKDDAPAEQAASFGEPEPQEEGTENEAQESTSEEDNENLSETEAPSTGDVKPKSFLASRRPQSNSPPPTPAPAPMSASTLQKMKSEGMYRNQYFKDAECFECGHKFKVSRSARSTTCPNCSATIPLDDVEVNMPTGESIRTRGDVLIRKRGQVSAERIECKDFRCQGILEANVTASGDAIFRATGTMIGEIHCRRFIIEKGSDVVFLNEIHAEEVEVQAKITGTLFSSGPLVIGINGSVNGDVTARSVSIEPGGELNGAMNIVRSKTLPPPISEV